MSFSITVALVEDDEDLRAMLARFLASVDMEVHGFAEVAALDAAFSTIRPHIIVLDVNLPGEDGFVAAARLRARSMIGIIMLTGRTARSDRLFGLSMGVDHYLTKPVDLRELESVIRNLARRLDAAPQQAPTQNEVAVVLPWTLHREGWCMTAPNGLVVDLTSAEYQLLGLMLSSPGQPTTREKINTQLGKPRIDVDNRSLDVLVSRTRRKVEEATGQLLPVKAVRGTGYVFTGMAKIEGAV